MKVKFSAALTGYLPHALDFHFLIWVWPEFWKSFRHLHFDRIFKQAVLMLKDPNPSIDTICTNCHIRARAHTHTHTHTHLPVTWTSWRWNCYRLMSLVEYIKTVSSCTSHAGEMQMNSSKKTPSKELHQGVSAQLAYYIQLLVVHAIADLHLQLPLHTWECTGFVDSISRMLNLRVSQNKEPSRALNSDT